ncbi:MAG: LPD7 domain-containing protein [Inquilinus sp.]|uniref:LPD7 domain-containing protein n=1 Tax=Inquilinus sp. TaxID=1932117 RepID=UPI003F346079
MALADRARDALRPTNSIEAIPGPAQARRAGSPPGPAQPGPGAASPAAPGKKPAPYTTEPPSIANTYYVQEKRGERQYFEDYQRKNLAMRATDTSVSSKRQDLNTVRAMLEIAEARGWHSVEIKGTAEFRREAWIEATARGLEGRGFTPSDADRQEADRRQAERGRANEVRAVARDEAREDRATGRPVAAAAHEREAQARQPGEPPAPALNDNRRILREAQKELSADGRIMLAALSEKIDRQMNRLNTEAKAELKAFVGTELVKKERAEGPTVLSAEQKRAATAPAPERASPAQTPPAPARRIEPEAPRRSLKL